MEEAESVGASLRMNTADWARADGGGSDGTCRIGTAAGASTKAFLLGWWPGTTLQMLSAGTVLDNSCARARARTRHMRARAKTMHTPKMIPDAISTGPTSEAEPFETTVVGHGGGSGEGEYEG